MATTYADAAVSSSDHLAHERRREQCLRATLLRRDSTSPRAARGCSVSLRRQLRALSPSA
jgi:hypothetical protein